MKSIEQIRAKQDKERKIVAQENTLSIEELINRDLGLIEELKKFELFK